MRQDFVEEAAKGWIACAMEGNGYAPWEIRRIMAIAYRYQHDAGCTPWEDAVKQYGITVRNGKRSWSRRRKRRYEEQEVRMTQEQRERVEKALISMIENAPSINFKSDNPHKSVSSEHMKAAAEVTYALIALQESASACSPNMRVGNTVGGKLYSVEATPLRGITIKMPNREDEG